MRTFCLLALVGALCAVTQANAAPYAQLSSTQTQMADKMPKVLTLNQTDAAQQIDNKDGTITLKQDGTYFIIAAGQVGGKGKGTVRLWLRQNGKDVANSNTEQTVENGSTSVLVCQGLGEFKAGDQVQAVFSATGPGLGMIASEPAGEPVVPSMIVSAFQVTKDFAQLSSSESQPAKAGGNVITLNSTDAAKGIENKDGAVAIKEAGTYFVVAAGQAGATQPAGKGTVRLWMRQNGTDVANSNTEQTIENRSTAVLVCQGVGEFKAGDKLHLVQAAKGAGVGMVASKPAGEAEIPSMIFSAFQVSGKAYGQLSSLKSQMPKGEGTIALEQTDAASGLENANGKITVKTEGTYFVMAAGQVGGTGKGTVRLWVRQNGKDVSNSNTEQSIAGGSTAVLVCQGVMELKAGDTVELAQSATAPGLGMVASTPGDQPAIPSMILSIVRLD